MDLIPARRAVARAARGGQDHGRWDAKARRAFDALACTHRREFARWVAEAKREETRDRRVAQALEMIRAGRTRT
ncbi:MAG: YdeI/OmpD-associated family protein [Solirubrobacteraceae bacterium]